MMLGCNFGPRLQWACFSLHFQIILPRKKDMDKCALNMCIQVHLGMTLGMEVAEERVKLTESLLVLVHGWIWLEAVHCLCHFSWALEDVARREVTAAGTLCSYATLSTFRKKVCSKSRSLGSVFALRWMHAASYWVTCWPAQGPFLHQSQWVQDGGELTRTVMLLKELH
jgi:hypothetical protein